MKAQHAAADDIGKIKLAMFPEVHFRERAARILPCVPNLASAGNAGELIFAPLALAFIDRSLDRGEIPLLNPRRRNIPILLVAWLPLRQS